MKERIKIFLKWFGWISGTGVYLIGSASLAGYFIGRDSALGFGLVVVFSVAIFCGVVFAITGES